MIIGIRPQFLDTLLDDSSEDEMADFIVKDVVKDDHGGPSKYAFAA